MMNRRRAFLAALPVVPIALASVAQERPGERSTEQHQGFLTVDGGDVVCIGNDQRERWRMPASDVASITLTRVAGEMTIMVTGPRA